MDNVLEGSQLLNEGTKIRLLDGREVDFKFTMVSLVSYEKKFGSFIGGFESLEGKEGEEAENPKMFTLVAQFLFVGLTHLGLTFEEVVALLDLKEFQSYMSAIVEQIQQAFPKQKAGDADPKVMEQPAKTYPTQTGII